MELMARVCESERMNFERLAARVFVAGGGAFWAVAAFSGDVAYLGRGVTEGVSTAAIPLAIAVLALLLGWFYEVLAGAVLLAGSAGVVIWGVLAGWGDAGLWWLMIGVLITPMVLAALLFFAAARMQRICDLEE